MAVGQIDLGSYDMLASVRMCILHAIVESMVFSKTAITLTPPKVGGQSADLSADKMLDFSSFFIGRQKINYKYLVIFFSVGRQFWGFGNRPMVGRRSADNWPMSYLNEPHIIGRCVGRPSADDRPIVARHLSSADMSTYRRPTIGRL